MKEHFSIVRTVLLPELVIAAPEPVEAVHNFHVQELNVFEEVTECNVEKEGVGAEQLVTDVPVTTQDEYCGIAFDMKDDKDGINSLTD